MLYEPALNPAARGALGRMLIEHALHYLASRFGVESPSNHAAIKMARALAEHSISPPLIDHGLALLVRQLISLGGRLSHGLDRDKDSPIDDSYGYVIAAADAARAS